MEAAGVYADDAQIVIERLVKRYPLPGVDGDEAAGLLVEVTAA
jgi:Zn-dependent alcohol dehydrogenase